MAKERGGKWLESYLKKHPESLNTLAAWGAGIAVALCGPDKKSVNRILKLMGTGSLFKKEINQIDDQINKEIIRRKVIAGEKEIVRSP